MEALVRQRWWYLSGVGFAVALVVGFMMSAGTYPKTTRRPTPTGSK
jgi:hypothetical protein